MKLIPKTHTAAFQWINQAWAMLEISPLDTGVLLAKSCGFDSWEDLSVAITQQGALGDHLVLSEEATSQLDGALIRQLKARQSRVLLDKRPYGEDFVTEFVNSMNILNLEKITTECSRLFTPLSELLTQITNPERGEDLDLKRHVENSGNLASQNRLVDAQQYLAFAECMGWNIQKDTFVQQHQIYDASFYLSGQSGESIPVFVFPLSTEPDNPADQLARDIKRRISTLADLAGWDRVIVLWGECFTLADQEQNFVTFVGNLFDEGTWLDMFVNNRTKTVESLFDINRQINADLKAGKQFLPYMLDTGFWAAQAYSTHIAYPE